MRVRILGFIFSGIFALCVGLIGFEVTTPYLALIRKIYSNTDTPWFVFSSSPDAPFTFEVLSRVLFTVLGALVGFLLGSIVFRRMVEVGKNLRRIPAEDKIACTIGTVLFSLPALIVAQLLSKLAFSSPILYTGLLLLEAVFFIWIGNVIMLSMKEELKFLVPGAAQRVPVAPVPSEPQATIKLLDTNVIIDGRIYDICRAGFLEGEITLPSFVLEELQHIADSADPLRRNRGRRGLDILNQMQKELDSVVRVMDRYKVSFSPGDGVDIKLVKLAKALEHADIVTNDYNLNKVAKIHGVRVLNINELANAVKPVVLPGEEMTINIIREGKEYNQGVGYLDDGTMVVVENGKKMLGETVVVAVSSVLQTVAGKMIFAELRTDNGRETQDEHNGYTASRGGRRKTL